MSEQVIVNGTHEIQSKPKEQLKEIPMAKLAEIVVTDYMRESIDKVARAEGFQNYDFIVDHGSGIGDGFAGIIFKIKIQEMNSDKSLSVLAKVPLQNKTLRDTMKLMSIYEREVYIYSVMIPEFVALQKEHKISESMGFYNFPKVYFAEYSTEKDDSIIIMEDLRDSGHKMWLKHVPVNFEHAKYLMIALGRLHALSFAMKAKKPEQFEKYKPLVDHFSKNLQDSQFDEFIKGSLLRAIQQIKPEETKLKEKMMKLFENMRATSLECVNPEIAEPYSVMNHGDCWINNFLFHYTKRSLPDNIVLIDWQVSRYCSPVIDLLYFIFACTDHQLRSKHYDELLNIYHHSLKELLERLGGDASIQFPFTTLLRQLKKFGKFGVLMAAFIIPMLQTKKEDIVDMDYFTEQIKDNPEIMQEMMKQFNERMSGEDAYNERIRGVMLDALKFGYL